MSFCHEREFSRLDPCSLGSESALPDELLFLLNRPDIPLTFHQASLVGTANHKVCSGGIDSLQALMLLRNPSKAAIHNRRGRHSVVNAHSSLLRVSSRSLHL